MKWIIAILFLAPPDIAQRVSVEMAFAPLPAQSVEVSPSPVGCPGGCKCDNGLLIHGDGHRTRCKCPRTCQCQKSFPD